MGENVGEDDFSRSPFMSFVERHFERPVVCDLTRRMGLRRSLMRPVVVGVDWVAGHRISEHLVVCALTRRMRFCRRRQE